MATAKCFKFNSTVATVLMTKATGLLASSVSDVFSIIVVRTYIDLVLRHQPHGTWLDRNHLKEKYEGMNIPVYRQQVKFSNANEGNMVPESKRVVTVLFGACVLVGGQTKWGDFSSFWSTVWGRTQKSLNGTYIHYYSYDTIVCSYETQFFKTNVSTYLCTTLHIWS